MANLDVNYEIDRRVEAFEYHQTSLLISLAGPGTGKTYSFLRRLRALIERDGIQPQEICYLTFIKEIAMAFLLDYKEEFPNTGDETDGPRISTLHSLACRLIRNSGFRLGYDGQLYFASIADRKSEESRVFLNDLLPIIRALGPRMIPQLRGHLEEVKRVWRDSGDPGVLPEQTLQILDASLRLSRVYRLIDWDEAIPMAHDLFLNTQNRYDWLTRLHHFMVDEYQDFNPAEQAFLMSLASNVASMVIVGDDKQSIFGGRGGSPNGMRDLLRSAAYDRVSLLRCYRCKSNILNAANRFLLWMSTTAQGMLAHHDGGISRCLRFKSTKAEIAYLVDFLVRSVGEIPENPSYKDGVVCLFPTRRLLGFYYEQIRVSVPSYTRKIEPDETRRQLALLFQLVINPNQRFVERRILELYQAIKPRHKQLMVRLLLKDDISPADAVNSLVNDGTFSGAAEVAGLLFVALCHNLSSQDSDLVADAITQQLGYKPEGLCDSIEYLLNHFGDTNQDELIKLVCDRILPESVHSEEDPRSVLFLTMHGSKGLTKRTVVLPGLEQAWLPGESTGSDLEERKRLFYVAITRATDDLLITYPRTRARGDPFNFDRAGRGEASIFVRRAGIPISYHP